MSKKGGVLLGDFIVQLRKARKLSQEKLAFKSELSHRTVFLVEKDRLTNLRFDTLRRIATALGLTLVEFFEQFEAYTEEVLQNAEERKLISYDSM